MDLLTQNQDKINWKWLSRNPNAMDLLIQNLDKIDWKWLSCNPNAMDLLMQNQDKINWRNLSRNPSICTTYDYVKIREANAIKTQCVQEYFNHPRFVEEFLQTHDIDELDSFHEWQLNRYVV